MKPKHIRRHLALITTIATCGTATPALSQSIFDVYLLADTTGSMGSLINGVQLSSNALVDSFLGTGNDVVFGVGEFKDGFVDPFAFRHNLVEDGLPIFTSDSSLITSAISQWTASGGDDFPEDNLLALRHVADSSPWRDSSRRIIYIFGDAPSLVTGSDGTTLDDTLASLAANCVEVVFIDLGRMTELEGQNQIDAILANELDCDRDPGDSGDYLELSLAGLTPEEAAARILETLSESFDGISGGGGGVRPIIATGNLMGSMVIARTMTRDVGGRLSGMRAGLQPATFQHTQPGSPAMTSAKGGSGKGVAVPSSTITREAQWHVWGQLFYSDESQDARNMVVVPGTAPRMVRADTDIDVFGGTVGVERRLGHGLTAGLALSLADSDVKMRNVGKTNIDTFALIPYVSYYRPNVFQGADFYGDILYAYSDSDYSTSRLNGARGSTDGNSHTIELNAGLNLRAGNVIHGPFAQYRYLDGDIDGYTETGPGALAFADASFKSSATQLGYQVSLPMAVQGGTLVPQFHAAWEHEFKPEQGNIGGIPLGELDEDLAVLGAGVGYYLSNGWNMALNYEARLGSDTENHYVGVRVGVEF